MEMHAHYRSYPLTLIDGHFLITILVFFRVVFQVASGLLIYC